MKKLLMGIIALTLALSFTACGEDSKKDSGKEETKQTETKKDDKKANPTDAAEDTVKGFMDAFCEFDFKEMEKYADGELPEEITEIDFTAIKDETINSLPEEMGAYKSQFEKMFDTAIDDMLATISYDITSVKETDDNITVKVDLTMADFNALESTIEDALSSDMEESIMKIATDAMESGDLTEDATEQDVIDYIMPKAIDLMGDILSDEIKGLEKTTEECEFILSEVDGEWLIDIEKSDL